jgi:pimeloyl-ACP methyl ester carboxylesterase
MKSEPTEENWKPLVVTVHGVGIFGRSGAWQPVVADALQEHFRFRHIRHHYYCLFAGGELVLEPLLVLLLLPLWMYVAYAHLSGRWIIVATLLSVLFPVAAYRARPWRHRLACKDFRNEIGAICREADKPPHLIAHSLGSYLSCRTLQDDPDLIVARIILVGSVVHEDFPWMQLSRSKIPQFEAVFNEVAPLDLVVRGATLFRSWLPDPRFGSSGIGGFSGSFVHYINEPLRPCTLCHEVGTSRVHNVQYRHARHSSAFLEPDHASVFWLPYLWGYDSAQFGEFVRLCLDADRFDRDKDRTNFVLAMARLRTASWGVPGLTVQKYMRRLTWGKINDSAEAAAVLLTWPAVVRAQAAAANPAYENRRFWLRCLRPAVAIEYAVHKVLGHGA